MTRMIFQQRRANLALVAMDAPTIEGAEEVSDYGSDFTPDEEEILASLLHHDPELDNPIQDPDLQLKHPEGHEGPHGVRIPRRMEYQPSSQGTPMQLSAAPEKRVKTKMDGDQRNNSKKSWSFDS